MYAIRSYYVHANSCAGASVRLQQLIAEVVPNPMDDLIQEAVDLVIFIKRTQQGRKIDDIAVINQKDAAIHKLKIPA